MKIQIDTHADSPTEMGIAIATLIAFGAPLPKVTGPSAEVIYREVPATGDFNAQACRESFDDAFHKVPALLSFDLWQYVWKKALGLEALRPGPEAVSASSLAGNLLFRRGDLTGTELTELVRELNEEIYKRSKELKGEISLDDNPSTGVEKDAVMGGPNSAAGSEKVDLSAVFGMAAKGPSDADIVSENQKSTDEQKDLAASPVTLDKAGLPWDSRIHAGSKAINQTDGLWRQRRGVDPAVVATVEAELRQAMSVPAAYSASYQTPENQSVHVAPYTHGSADLDADAAKLKAMGGDPGPTLSDIKAIEERRGLVVPPPPPTAVTPPAPPPAADTGEIDSLPRLLKFITEQKLAGKLNQTQVNQALIAVGIEGPLPVLQARPDLIPTVAGKLRALAGV